MLSRQVMLSRQLLQRLRPRPSAPRYRRASSNSTADRFAAHHDKAVELSGAPDSIRSIPDAAAHDVHSAGAVIRPLGCTRRVFLREPYLTTPELEGLAYRIRTLSKNEGLNSVLIATDAYDDDDALPSTIHYRDEAVIRRESVDDLLPPAPGQTYFCAGGYDALELYQSGRYKEAHEVERLLTSVKDLALATRGHTRDTKIPVITIPHGAVQDSGFALCLSSYVLATHETTFRIRNPSRGLSLDPVGFSYLLPRLGQEFGQPAAEYIGCGILMGCMGFEADASDLVETGLATNYMESPQALHLLEMTLAELPPWNQQGLTKNPIEFYGDEKSPIDHQAAFRNVGVADAIFCCTQYRADGTDMWDFNDKTMDVGQDVSLDFDPTPWHEARSSDLVNYAATFDPIFSSKDTSLVLMHERLREVAARTTNDPEEQEGIDVARDLCERLEQQSPLAVHVVFQLLQLGAREGETLETCMERELRAQTKLMGMSDFEHWAQHAERTEPLDGWKHKSLADVTNDEVLEVIGD